MPLATRIARPVTVVLAMAGFFGVSGLASPQNPTPVAPAQAPPATGVIVGVVLEADGTTPVPGAIVRAFGPPLGAGRGNLNDAIETGADGRFLFRSLPKGRYTLRVQKAGYIDGALGARNPISTGLLQGVDLDDGQRVKDVSITLWKYATLSGTVVDEAGEPIVGATVKACRRTAIAGVIRLDFQANEGSALTDDRGVYRHTNLLPGEYVVIVASASATIPASLQASYQQSLRDGDTKASDREVTASSAAQATTSGARVGDYVVSFGRVTMGSGSGFRRPGPGELPLLPDGRISMYRTTMYPNATRVAEAGIVTLGAGEEREGVNIQLRPVVGTTVSGTVIGPKGPQGLFGLRLYPAGAEEFNINNGAGMMNSSTITDAAGRFVFMAVAPGQYTLHGIYQPQPPERTPNTPPGPLPIPDEPTLWVSMPLSVGEAGLTGVQVSLQPGHRITGRVEFEGTAARPAPDRIAQIRVDADSADARIGGFGILGQDTPLVGRVDASGQFVTYGLPPGKYVMTVGNVPGWTLKTIMYNSRDVSSVALEIGDRDIDGVVITLTDKPTKLSGTVHSDGHSDATADVVIFPTEASGWIEVGAPSRRVRVIRTGRDGSYSYSGLPPGDYFIVAIPDERSANITEAKKLQSLVGSAARIRIDAGAAVTRDLDTVRVK